METILLCIRLLDRKTNQWIRAPTRVCDAIQSIARLKCSMLVISQECPRDYTKSREEGALFDYNEMATTANQKTSV